MKIRFLGPLGKVTGSCTWMRDEDRGWNFLVDCGMQQGETTAKTWNQGDWPFEPKSIRFVVLTHAHLDHCGLLPVLYRDGFRGSVYCTKETSELAIAVLEDAAKFPESEFSKDDVARILWHEPQGKPLLGNHHPVDQDLYVQFVRSGHIVGAVSATVYWGPKGDNQKSITFSGDVGPGFEDSENLPLVRFAMHPSQANFVVLESTYGGIVRPSEQKDPAARRSTLRSLLDRVLERNGTLLLPAFALGRTQNLMFDISQIVLSDPSRFGGIKFLVDSPAAIKMHSAIVEAFTRTDVTKTSGPSAKVRPTWLGKQFFRELGLDDKSAGGVQRAKEIISLTLGIECSCDPTVANVGNDLAKDWRQVFSFVTRKGRQEAMDSASSSPTVVIVGSGMCDGGPAVPWLQRVLPNDGAHIALTGYCATGTVGRTLSYLKSLSKSELARHSGILEWESVENEKTTFQISDIRASISNLSGYSEHADQDGLLNWVIRSRHSVWQAAGSVVFLQHGEDTARLSLAKKIEEVAGSRGLSIKTVCPDASSGWFDLDIGGAKIIKERRQQELIRQKEAIDRELAELL